MHGFFRWSHVFHDFLLVSMGFLGGYIGFHGFWLVSPVFQGDFMDFGWFPWFSMWFLFFLGFWFHGFIYDLEGIGVPC